MIVMQMCGGLGNQMFQYALGRRLSLDRKTPLILDVAAFASTEARGETPRTYRLKFLCVDAEVTLEWQGAVLAHARPHERIEILGLNEVSDAFNPQVLECPAHTYLIGYWQTEKYFGAVSDVLRNDFQLLNPLTPARQSWAQQMESTTSVSVHIRRGDFVTHPGAILTHGTCSPEWYVKAMNIMSEALENVCFYVFSDDPEWGRHNLPKSERLFFIDPQPDGREFEDMHLMSRCRHHILANSSFSWWGAWLNPSLSKKVIAPERWVLTETNINDRLPATWIRF